MKMSSAATQRAFPSLPVGEQYLAIGSIEDTRVRVCRAIDRGEGLSVVIGPPGTGKSLLGQRIAAQYRTSHAVVLLGDMRVNSRSGLVQQVLFQLRLPHQGLDEESMQLSLIQCLTDNVDGFRPLLLIIDEAQMLSLELLDEIRMLTNLIRDGRHLVQTILIGGPRLEDPLADPQLESLVQRIAVRCYVHPMNFADSLQYIRSLLSPTGLTIDDPAVSAVHHACCGVPRLINQLMTRTLEFATAQRRRLIDEPCVQAAWADLQQLPSPVLEPQWRAPQSAIEFGELSDAPTVRATHSVPAALAETSEFETSTDNMSDDAFEPAEEASPESHYVDFASILQSQSIVCFPESSQIQITPELVAEPLPVPHLQPQSALRRDDQAVRRDDHVRRDHQAGLRNDQAARRDHLFGHDFDDEMIVDVRYQTQSPSPGMAAYPGRLNRDPAADEMTLHQEILQMSDAAKRASDRLSQNSIGEEAVDHDFDNDMPRQLAVEWLDDEPRILSLDDRDLIVIEDDVNVMIDGPVASIAGSAARKPVLHVEQQYQDLFHRMRTVND